MHEERNEKTYDEMSEKLNGNMHKEMHEEISKMVKTGYVEAYERLFDKYQKLIAELKGLGRVAVAFSGGVDSTFLLYAAKEALGKNVIAVSACLHSVPEWEAKEASDYCELMAVSQFKLRIDELAIPGFAGNPPNRCYLCKKYLFSGILELAEQNGCSHVIEGSNLDDEGDYRPGIAALKELGIISPLRITGFSKQEIRSLSEYFGLPTWNKPSYACLSSRFPYGEEITAPKLKRVEKAEKFLMDLGFYKMRVRSHGNVARIEIMPEEFKRILDEKLRTQVDLKLREYGFSYVALDLRGFRSGSMNEVL